MGNSPSDLPIRELISSIFNLLTTCRAPHLKMVFREDSHLKSFIYVEISILWRKLTAKLVAGKAIKVLSKK